MVQRSASLGLSIIHAKPSDWSKMFSSNAHNSHSRAVHALLIATPTVGATRELVSKHSRYSCLLLWRKHFPGSVNDIQKQKRIGLISQRLHQPFAHKSETQHTHSDLSCTTKKPRISSISWYLCFLSVSLSTRLRNNYKTVMITSLKTRVSYMNSE